MGLTNSEKIFIFDPEVAGRIAVFGRLLTSNFA
jgi:hypothetical protein